MRRMFTEKQVKEMASESFSEDIKLVDIDDIKVEKSTCDLSALSTSEIKTNEIIRYGEHIMLIRLCFRVSETPASSTLTLEHCLPSGFRPSRDWVGNYLVNTTANTTPYFRAKENGDLSFYSATSMNTSYDTEVVAWILW